MVAIIRLIYITIQLQTIFKSYFVKLESYHNYNSIAWLTFKVFSDEILTKISPLDSFISERFSQNTLSKQDG